jgi:hypothetical protein
MLNEIRILASEIKKEKYSRIKQIIHFKVWVARKNCFMNVTQQNSITSTTCICTYIVLKLNNNCSSCFRILCNSIYVERTKKKHSSLPLFTCDYPDCSPLMEPLNPSYLGRPTFFYSVSYSQHFVLTCTYIKYRMLAKWEDTIVP